MKRWRNEISQSKIDSGQQCGICHNGKTAFGTREEGSCKRCHIAGTEAAAKLHKVDQIDHEHISEVAKKVGAEWNPDKLPEGRIPVDNYGFIDWLTMKKKEVFRPIESLEEGYEQKIRDNQILFVSKSKVENVLFNHNVHSSWIKCESCHPVIFDDSLTNKVKMVRMSKGENCGYCHGKVSFTFADCKRCHSQEKGTQVADALVHIGQSKPPKEAHNKTEK